MELKLGETIAGSRTRIAPFNRTSMELKPMTINLWVDFCSLLLIEPVWN